MSSPSAPGRVVGPRRRRPRLHAMRRRVTFSRNLTLSLSRTCRCYCKYCAFATHQAHLYSPEEVIEMIDGAARRQVKELLGPHRRAARGQPARGRAPARVRPRGLHRLRRLDLRAGARARPAAAHQPGRLSTRGPGAPARGDRLAGADARVDLRAADGDRARRLADEASRRGAWRRSARRASCGSPSRAASSSGSARPSRSGCDSLAALAEVHARARPHPGGDPAELRPAPALLRPGAGGDRRRGGARSTGAPGSRTGARSCRCPTGPCRGDASRT